MRFAAISLLLAATPLVVEAYPQYAKRLAGSRNDNRAKYPILRRAAVPYSDQYPYTGAKLDGQSGTGKGGVQVPAPGDTAHEYQDPPPGAYRGPCPGLNTLANHGFLSRDGITTYTEMVAGLQNVYNVDFSTAVALTMLGFVFDGDPISEMMSIGGDATLITGQDGNFTGEYGGVSKHGTFELDVSLTRNDFYLNGDSYSFNGTLFGMMLATAKNTSTAANPLFDFNAMALYRSQQYDRARVENPWLYFPQLALHNYGAATFLYEAFPSSAKNNTPDLETISSFFGAVQLEDGTWGHVGERPPPNWHNRVTPMTLADVTGGIDALYAAYPKDFGANLGGTWFSLNETYTPSTGSNSSAGDSALVCGAYGEILNTALSAPQPYAMYGFVLEKAGPVFAPYNCSFPGLPTSIAGLAS
ncbi:Cloroperoxidase [Calocera viscosa TUFC12733]|uniref:Cloroperoxidase n=1 Tax=Calocera viscosa (strain TUFC12733) TaxID=1330018 RepID=A0A167K1R7_CALVF|nr:Cloroperoxidase [Calocera viscosa TUFC12733]